MAFFDDDTESPSTGHVSIMSGTHNPDNDRLRLGRELARDFQSTSFSSTSSHGDGGGRHNNGKYNNNNDDDSASLDSFDISNDAQGMSTRKLDMLQHTPTIDTQLLDQFPDFSMAGRDMTGDNIEIGRGGNNNNNRGPVDDSLRSVDFSSHHPFSIGGSTRKSERRLFSAVSNATVERKVSLSSTHSDPSELLQASSRRAAAAKGKGKARTGMAFGGQRLGSITNFDLSQIEISTPQNNRGRPGMGDQGGTKITDFVSNSGSGGSRSRFADIQRSLEYEDEGSGSDAGSISIRPRGFGNSRFGGSPKPRQSSTTTNVATGKKRPTRGLEKPNDLTDDLPAIVAKSRKQPATASKVPQNFKSTDAFLHELGLDGNTTTTDLKTRLNQLKDFDNTTIGITQQSFMLPQISDLSELISGYPGDATRMSLKRGPFNNTKNHRPIESIPVPHDERAVLMAMRLLQDKVADLESTKAEAEHRCIKLESELRKSETRIRLEQQKSKAAEETLTKGRGADSTLGGSDDGDYQERTKEKLKLELQMEKLKLEGSISTLHAQLDKSTRDIETAKIALKHMQEERNSAVNSVAMAIANNEDLKVSMEELKSEIQRLRIENHEHERRAELEREEWKDREDRLRRKAKAAKEAAIMAQGVMKEAARRDAATAAAVEAAEREAARAERREQRAREKEAEREAEREQERAAMEAQVRLQKEADEKREQERVIEQQRKLENLINQQLKELRPDLYTSKLVPLIDKPLRANQAFVQTAKSRGVKERAILLPKRSGRHATLEGEENEITLHAVTTQSSGEEEIVKKRIQEQIMGDDTMMSISPDEIRKIAREINAERRKRKAATNTVALEATTTEGAKPKEYPKRPRSMGSVPIKTAAAEQFSTQSLEPNEVSTKPSGSKKAPKTVKIAVLDKGKGIEVPTVASSNSETITAKSFDGVDQIEPPSQKPAKKTRLVKKVVYYYDEELTMSIPIEREFEEEYEDEGGLTNETMQTSAPNRDVVEQAGPEELTAEFDGSLTQKHDPTIRSASPLPPPVPAKIPIANPEIASEDPTTLPVRVQRVVNHLAAHDPDQCTVCHRSLKIQIREEELRSANPLADIDNSMAIPAPLLEPASRKRRSGRIINSYEEEPTPRPTYAPKRQLSKVVRQLQDEFAHLKLDYQTKADEFMKLDPTIGKKRRKTLTTEMSELVADMDYKCDQIYALYDVNEEFVKDSDNGDVESNEEVGDQESERGRAESDDENEYDLTGFTIPEMSIIDESTEADESDEEKRSRR